MCISTLLNNLSEEATLPNLLMKHSAVLTKNSKKKLCTSHNSKRTSYHLGYKKYSNCSMHAEMSVLHKYIQSQLRGKRKRSCVLRY